MVAGDAGSTGIAEQPDAGRRIGIVADDVAQADDGADSLSADIAKDRFERFQVGVDIRDDGDHRPRAGSTFASVLRRNGMGSFQAIDLASHRIIQGHHCDIGTPLSLAASRSRVILHQDAPALARRGAGLAKPVRSPWTSAGRFMPAIGADIVPKVVTRVHLQQTQAGRRARA